MLQQMADNVIRHAFRAMRDDLQGSGEPPDNGAMEARVAKLESLAEKTSERLVSIETRLTRMEANQDDFAKHYATKEDMALLKADLHKSLGDLQKTINDQTWKLIGTVVTLGTLLSAIVFYIARNVR
jgi:hypothetical protein